MPHSKRRSISDYWKNDPHLGTTSFGKFMSRNRFQLLLSTLHFASNERPNPRDRLWKVRNIMKMLTDRFSRFLVPFKKLVIDESLTLFKGRLLFKQFIRTKRHRFGFKQFVLCDCETGYILDILVYSGTNVDFNRNDPLGSTGGLVKTLLAPYMHKGHILYIDSYYSSPQLSRFLHTKKVGTCCTVRKTRKNMPPVFTNQNSRQGDYHLQKSEKILAMRWHDKREVTMLSTLHMGEMADSGKTDYRTGERILKPDLVLDYNTNMRLVDKADMMISNVECVRKTVRWHHKLFIHLLDVTLLNSYIIMLTQSGRRPTSLGDFTYSVGHQLLQKYGQQRMRHPGRPGIQQREVPDRLACAAWICRHSLKPIPPRPSEVASNRRMGRKLCHVCKKTTRRPKKNKWTYFICKECKIPLCPGKCYTEYHSLRAI